MLKFASVCAQKQVLVQANTSLREVLIQLSQHLNEGGVHTGKHLFEGGVNKACSAPMLRARHGGGSSKQARLQRAPRGLALCISSGENISLELIYRARAPTCPWPRGKKCAKIFGPPPRFIVYTFGRDLQELVSGHRSSSLLLKSNLLKPSSF